MATDLVRWNHQPQENRAGDEPEWDLPPTDPRPDLLHSPSAKSGARRADRDASQTRGEFAAVRETDAAEQRQSRWDWGDLRTWVWIGGMCLGFLLVCLFVYALPQGRHNQNDLPAPTPTFRGY